MSEELPKRHFFTPALILRLIFSTLLFIFVFILALNSVFGYRVDLTKISFTPSGIIQVNTFPPNSTVTINDQTLPFLSNNRTNVTGGNYLVKVSQRDYYDWQSVLPVKLRTVWWAEAKLVPIVKWVATVKSYNNLLSSFASPDRRFLLNHLADNQFELVDLRTDTPVYQKIDFTELLPAAEAALLNLHFFDWNLGSDSLIFQDIASGSKTTYKLSLNNISPTGLINLSTTFPGIKFDEIKIASSDGKTNFVRSSEALYRINFDNTGVVEKVADNVADYRVLNLNQLFFLQKQAVANHYLLKIYDYGKKSTITFREIISSTPILFDVFENKYDGFSYIALSHEHQFFVWRINSNKIIDPLANSSTETLATQNYFEVFKQANADLQEYFAFYNERLPIHLSIGGDGRFIVVNFAPNKISLDAYKTLADQMTKLKNQTSLTYNLPVADGDGLVAAPYRDTVVIDTNYRLRFDLKLAKPSGSFSLSENVNRSSWLSSEILSENLFGVVRIKDFNGQNQHKLIPASDKYDLQYTSNHKYIYFWQVAGDKPVLRRLQMLF